MDESELYLTEPRIRAVVRDYDVFMKKARSRAGKTMLSVPSGLPNLEAGETMINLLTEQVDALMGPGAGRFLADSNRLLYVLGVLEKGTREDAIASHQRRWTAIEAAGASPEVLGMMRANEAIYLQQLRAIPQSEIDAVMACLEDIQKIYPGPAKSVRSRHTKVDPEKLMYVVRSLRTGDLSRPQLTEERIRRVLDIVEAVVPGPSKMQLALGESTLMQYGRTAAEIFPVTTVKKLRAQGEAPDAFARDFVWMRFIFDFLKAGQSIDDRMLEEIPRHHAEIWIRVAYTDDARERTEKFAALVSRPLDLLCLVGREEEIAVKSSMAEIRSRLRGAAETQRAARIDARGRKT
jgi:hypothetical protein